MACKSGKMTIQPILLCNRSKQTRARTSSRVACGQMWTCQTFLYSHTSTFSVRIESETVTRFISLRASIDKYCLNIGSLALIVDLQINFWKHLFPTHPVRSPARRVDFSALERSICGKSCQWWTIWRRERGRLISLMMLFSKSCAKFSLWSSQRHLYLLVRENGHCSGFSVPFKVFSLPICVSLAHHPTFGNRDITHDGFICPWGNQPQAI